MSIIYKPEYYKVLRDINRSYKEHKNEPMYNWLKFKLDRDDRFWVGGKKKKLNRLIYYMFRGER